jgi:hypothetical protein
LARDTSAIGGRYAALARDSKTSFRQKQASFGPLDRASFPPEPENRRITKRSQFGTLIPMISLKQIEANRRNAEKSTGPITPEGKRRSRGNALRHGLTAETVIGVLESAEDYIAFETAVMAEYAPQSVVARELVVRLASLLWRLRRATAIETGLFEVQADPLAGFRRSLRAAIAPATAGGLNEGLNEQRHRRSQH